MSQKKYDEWWEKIGKREYDDLFPVCKYCGTEGTLQQKEIRHVNCEKCNVPFRASEMPYPPRVSYEAMDAWGRENTAEQRRTGIGCTPRPRPNIFDEKRAEIAREAHEREMEEQFEFEKREADSKLREYRKRKREAKLRREVEDGDPAN